MNIDKVDIKQLNIAAYNPRKDLKSSDSEYIKLKNSIEHFGYVEPIIVNKRGMVVVGGHQRLKVLQDLGYDIIDVVYVDLNSSEEKALNIALNKISGEWDAEKLEDLLRDLQFDTDLEDIELTGFSLDEIDTLYTGDLDDLQIELDKYTEEINQSKNKKKAICIQIGKDIRIEITGAQYDIIAALTPVEIVNRLTS